MITLTVLANITVEGASNEEEALEALMEFGEGSEIESITRGGPDAAPVYLAALQAQVAKISKAAIEEAIAGAAEEKKEFTEVGAEASEEVDVEAEP